MAKGDRAALAALEAGAEAQDQAPPRRSRTSGIERVLQILDHLQTKGEACTAYEVARAVVAPLSTVYGLIDDLVEKDVLERDPGGALWLGPRLYRYGLAYARNVDLLSAATSVMHRLAAQSGETVQICGRDGDDMVVLAMMEGRDHFQVTSRVGTRTPLNWTASGRLLVGHMSEEDLVALFARCGRPSPTGRAETDPVVLARSSREALAARLSIQAGESDFAVACIASPIQDPDGVCRATISIVVPERKAGPEAPDLVDLVRESAARVEAKLGWRR